MKFSKKFISLFFISPPRFKYRLQVDLSGVSEIGEVNEDPLMDAYIDYAPNNSFSVKST